jgi:hypothetical protein
MTDEAGEIVWSAEYKAWGEAKITVEKVKNPLRFQGQYFDHETGCTTTGIGTTTPGSAGSFPKTRSDSREESICMGMWEGIR